jgi:hypothetical protein
MEMEGKSNGVTKVVKEGGGGRQEGEGTTWMDILDYLNPLISPILQVRNSMRQLVVPIEACVVCCGLYVIAPEILHRFALRSPLDLLFSVSFFQFQFLAPDLDIFSVAAMSKSL